MKKCGKCGQEKCLSEFHLDGSKKDGHVTTCKECKADYDKGRKPEYKSVTKRESNLRSRYGIGESEYDSILESQGGRCAICCEGDKPLHVDHCHRSGVVRGLLCMTCNTNLGWLERISPSRVRDYLSS